MKNNIFLVSYDYDITKNVARDLASYFSMRVFDQKELFNFDNLPRSFHDMIGLKGIDFVKQKFKSILKMQLTFQDSVFVADNCFAENCADLFEKIKETNLVILLQKNIDDEYFELNEKQYKNQSEKNFYDIDKDILIEREQIIKENCADICVDISNLKNEKIIDEITKKIREFYKA